MDRLKQALIEDPRYKAARQECLGYPGVLVALTNYCNFRCAYCSLRGSGRRANLDVGLAKDIVAECAQRGWDFSFGQTGEPLLHPRAEEIIRFVHETGREFTTGTNGSTLTEKHHDLPMSVILSYSPTREDFAYRGSGMDYDLYARRVHDYIRHRIRHNVPGYMHIQFADYDILRRGTTEYDKEIRSVDELRRKTAAFAALFGLPGPDDPEEWKARIAQRQPVVLHEEGKTRLAAVFTKILPNTYEAFGAPPPAPGGYCDSCHLMMSIQADGSVAYCCCDPTAKCVADRMKPGDSLLDVWLGEGFRRVREAFDRFQPLHPFCYRCLQPVSEHIKPHLTVRAPQVVAGILRDLGVTGNLPWFRFPA